MAPKGVFLITATQEEMYNRWPTRNYRQRYSYQESVVPYIVNMGGTEDLQKRIINAIEMYQRRFSG